LSEYVIPCIHYFRLSENSVYFNGCSPFSTEYSKHVFLWC